MSTKHIKGSEGLFFYRLLQAKKIKNIKKVLYLLHLLFLALNILYYNGLYFYSNCCFLLYLLH